MRASEAWPGFTKSAISSLTPWWSSCRIFSFTRSLPFSLVCLGGSCWNTSGVVASQIFQEPSSLSPSLQLMALSTPVQTALVDFAGQNNNCFAHQFFLHPSQEKVYESCLKILLSVFLTRLPPTWEDQRFTAAVLWQQQEVQRLSLNFRKLGFKLSVVIGIEIKFYLFMGKTDLYLYIFLEGLVCFSYFACSCVNRISFS